MGKVPVFRDDEDRIILFVRIIMVPRIRESLAGRFSRQGLVAALEAYIRRGRAETDEVLALAEAGDEMAAIAAKNVFDDMIDAGEMPGAALRTFGRSPPRKRKPGRRGGVELWARNIYIALSAISVAEFFGVHPTRDQKSHKTMPASACSIVHAALGMNVSESTIQNIYLSISGITRMMGLDLHESVRRDLAHMWPQWAALGPARLSGPA